MTEQATAEGPRAEGPGEWLPPVAVILVHWARASIEDTLECLESLAAVDYPRFGVILVNNGAPRFPKARFQQAMPDLLILTSEHNLGFTGGNNLGIEAAMRAGAELILLLNNDTVVRPDLVRAMLPAMARGDVGIAGPVITYYDAPDRIWFAGGTYNRWLGFTFHSEIGEEIGQPPRGGRVDWITGCALLVKRGVFEQVGTLWDDLFIYFEDAEFCLRAARAGYRCVLVEEPLVRHKVSASMGERGARPFSPVKGYYFGRNPQLLLRRNAGRFWRSVGMLGFLGGIVPYNAVQCLAAANIRALVGLVRGVRDGLAGRSGQIPE